MTGGNTGVGYQTCLELARKGARVYMASRSEDRANEAIASIKKELGDSALIEFLKLDLMDLKQVKASAEEWLKKGLSLNILINNAGTYDCRLRLNSRHHGVPFCSHQGWN